MRNRTKDIGEEEYHLQQSEMMLATEDFREGGFAFITEGSLALRELGNYGVTKPISNGESAITALITGKSSKKIYGATSGKQSHLFYYDPSPAAEHVVDIGILGKDSACRNLMVDKDGVIYGILNPSGRIFRYVPEGEYSLIWTYKVNEIEFFDESVEEEVASAVLQSETNIIYGITKNTSKLFSFNIDTRSLKIVKEIEKAGKSNAIAIDKKGNIFGSSRNCLLFCYNTGNNALEILDIQLPSPKGMEYLNHIDSLVYDGNEYIYGGTTLGTIFRLNTATLELTGYGRPIPDHRIRSLVIGNDGMIYGCAGAPEKVSHLFALNPKNGEVKDLGIPMVHFPKNWICYDISALSVGRNGEIYIGKSERISYLLIYYPPVKKRNIK
ncbi:MAG: PQQ-like beta-propeller repeat protein [Spirochaetales bacterium]|nr:PQQ-like beta-propeller repeat protein [Spirochaetales bacterium]